MELTIEELLELITEKALKDKRGWLDVIEEEIEKIKGCNAKH